MVKFKGLRQACYLSVKLTLKFDAVLITELLSVNPGKKNSTGVQNFSANGEHVLDIMKHSGVLT